MSECCVAVQAVEPAQPVRYRPRCVHCGRRQRNRPRRLCGPCHDRPEIRELYPVVKNSGRAYVNRCAAGGRPLPRRPTSALPGTPAKIRVMASRDARGELLHHPMDAQRP
jgi:hypothetical protein